MALLTKNGYKTKLASMLGEAGITEENQAIIDSLERTYSEALDNLSTYGDVVDTDGTEEFEFVGAEVPKDYEDVRKKNDLLEQENANIRQQYLDRFKEGSNIAENNAKEEEVEITDNYDDLLTSLLKEED